MAVQIEGGRLSIERRKQKQHPTTTALNPTPAKESAKTISRCRSYVIVGAMGWSSSPTILSGTLPQPRSHRSLPHLRRRAVTWAISEKGYAQRRPCQLIGLQPKTYRYASTRPDDGTLRTRLKELASQRRRFGYRRLGSLAAIGSARGPDQSEEPYRLYKEERLTVRKRGGRKWALGMSIPQD